MNQKFLHKFYIIFSIWKNAMYELNGLTMYYCDEVQNLTSVTLFSALWSQMQHNVQYTTSETLKIIKQLFYRQSNSGTVFFLPIKFWFYYLTGKIISWIILRLIWVTCSTQSNQSFRIIWSMWYTKWVVKICFNLCQSYKFKKLVFSKFSVHRLESYCDKIIGGRGFISFFNTFL